nr:FIG01363442: possible membrane protein [Kibdelosporangium sp. MJ126-NF4]CTQ91063.1 FIG01363442: possible membrane protein [Kibdelosporangium sp. MJ126-NF4]
MFGIIRPCRHRLSLRLHGSWLAHLCGLCLALRDEHGQLARAATNYDGLVISALVEAQSDSEAARRTAGPCPLRAMRSASVAHGDGARLAAAVSLVLASAKVSDHIDDGDGAMSRPGVSGVARRVAKRWAVQGTSSGSAVGFDTAVLLDAVARQSAVELSAGSLLEVTEPTETAAAAAFGHTAVVSGRPANAAALGEAGRLFGRIAHLVDAVEDLIADQAAGVWNPLTATGTSLVEARRHCDDAALGMRLALDEVAFVDDRLVRALLVDEVYHAIHRAFSHASDGKRKKKKEKVEDGSSAVADIGEGALEIATNRAGRGCCSHCDCCDCSC